MQSGSKRVRVRNRMAVTLVELLVVLAIIGALLGLLLPAVQSSREKAREATCKNNLRQLSLAFAQLHEVTKKLPAPPPDGQVGGWSFEILQFLEQRQLYELVGRHSPLTSLPAEARRRPSIMTCPVTTAGMSRVAEIEASHFVLTPNATREWWLMFDAAADSQAPWLTGPELQWQSPAVQGGPHAGGVHQSRADGAVTLILP